MSKELLRMKRLANLITEGEYIKENESYKTRPITQNDWPLEEFGFETTLYDSDSPEGEPVDVMFNTLHDFNSDEEAKQHFDKLFDPSSNEMWEEYIKTEAKELGMDINDLEYDNIRPVTFVDSMNENEYEGKTFSARKLLGLIAQGFKTSPLYQDDVQLSYDEAVNMISQAIELEGSEGPADGALNDYINSGKL